MSGIIGTFLRHNQQVAENGRRLEDQVDNNRRAGQREVTDKIIETIEDVREEEKKRRQNSLSYQNETLKIRNKKLTEALAQVEDFARHKFLECEGLKATIGHLQDVWNTDGAVEAMTDDEKMGALIDEKNKEVLVSEYFQEKAETYVAEVTERSPRMR